MKRLLVVVLLALSSSVFSAPMTIDLNDVPVRDLARLVWSQIVKKSVVFDAAFSKDEQLVSLSLKRVEPRQIELEAMRLIESHGYDVQESGGVLRIARSPEKEKEQITHDPFVYVPQHRPVSYLLDLASAFFKQGSFSSMRSLSGSFGGPAITQVQGTQGQGAVVPVSVQQAGVNTLATRDPDLLVFNGSSRDVERLKKLLAQIDTPANEVLVKAVVYEVQTSKRTGSALSLAFSILAGSVGLTIDNRVTSGAFLKYKNSALNLDAVFNALSSDDRFKVVTAPTVRVRSGASARFAVGNETPVLDRVTFDQLGKPIQSIVYKPSGVIFDITPSVRAESSDLQIFQQISQFVPTTNGVDTSPTLIKRELQTSVSASDEDVIVIGGLDEKRDTSSESGQSFLPRLFWSEKEENQRTEIMLVLHVQRI